MARRFPASQRRFIGVAVVVGYSWVGPRISKKAKVMNRIRRWLLGVVGLWAVPAGALAATHVWDGELADSDQLDLWSSQKSSIFGTTTNWGDTDAVPGSGDTVLVEGAGSSKITGTYNLAKATIEAASFEVDGDLIVADPFSIEGLTGGYFGEIHAMSQLTFKGTNTNSGVFLRGTGTYFNVGTFTVYNPIETAFINNSVVNFSPRARTDISLPLLREHLNPGSPIRVIVQPLSGGGG